MREPGAPAPRQPRFLDRIRDVLHPRHGSRRTEKSHVAWIRCITTLTLFERHQVRPITNDGRANTTERG